MKWKKTIIITMIILLVGFIVGWIYMSSHNMAMQDLFAGQYEGKSEFDLTGINTFETKDGFSKNYSTEDKRIIIKDTKDDTTIVDIKLTSPINNFVGVGNDIKIAEFQVEDFSTITELFDRIDFYDLKDNLKIKPRDFTYKYGVDYIVETCNDIGNFKEEKIICFNSTETNWTEFIDVKNLPSKNIRIGLFTRTYPNENIEWIPTIKGFEISEWATFFVNSYENIDQSTNGTNLDFYNTTMDNVPTNDTLLLIGIYAGNVQNVIPTIPLINISGVNASYTGLVIARSNHIRFWLYTVYNETYTGQQITADFKSDDMSYIHHGVLGIYNATNTNNGLDLIIQSNTSHDQTGFVNVTLPSFTDSVNNALLAFYFDCGTCSEDELGGNLTKIGSDATADFVEFSVGQSGEPADLSFALNITAGSSANSLEIFLLEIQPESDGVDTEAPKWMTNSTNSTVAGTLINHSVYWTDTALSNFTFSIDNGTGTFINDSSVSMTGATNQSAVVKFINQTVGSTIRWIVYAWDLIGNNNITSTFTYDTTSANCWTYDSGSKYLQVPTGCLYTGNLTP